MKKRYFHPAIAVALLVLSASEKRERHRQLSL
jgi:hypothetical protein